MFAGKDIDYSTATIRNDGFWPDVAVSDFERRRALPAVQRFYRLKFSFKRACRAFGSWDQCIDHVSCRVCPLMKICCIVSLVWT